ncbi:hypothetical protein ACFLZ9_00340 [Patescibacteria group bacterium]
MSLDKQKFEITKPPTYEVDISKNIRTEDIHQIPQLAYVVNPETYKIIITRSGHAKTLRSYDKRDFQGGWIFPRQGKITFYSGTLGEAKDQDQIKWAIEGALGISFRSPNKHGKKSYKYRENGD